MLSKSNNLMIYSLVNIIFVVLKTSLFSNLQKLQVNYSRNLNIYENNFSRNNKNRKLRILLYGTFYSSTLFPGFDIVDCDIKKEFYIQRRGNFKNFDVIVIHFMDYNHFLKFNKKSRKKMRLIILVLEPPYSVNRHFKNSINTNKYFYSIISYFYSSFYNLPYGNYFYTTKSGYDENQILNEFKKRSNKAFALISNCYSKTIRIKIIKYLKTRYDIDGYGNCFNNKLSKEEKLHMFKKYKFYIAFENSLCPEYVTEKYWNSIRSNTIPIVISHSESRKYMIPGSYIDLYSFDSMQSFLNEIEKTANDFSHYKKYFKWKESISMTTKSHKGFDSCEFLHKLKKNIHHYNFQDTTIFKTYNLSICININDQNRWFEKFID